jgi:hypothetical protein
MRLLKRFMPMVKGERLPGRRGGQALDGAGGGQLTVMSSAV